MERAVINGTMLEYKVSGAGEPVVFIHGALIADAFIPLLTEPSLAGKHRLITYHRRGYMGSGRILKATTLKQQADDCRGLLRHLGIQEMHVVGHSYGGAVALQLAMDAPSLVRTLALLEPALIIGATAQSYREALAKSSRQYKEESVADTVDAFLKARFGAAYRSWMDKAAPGAFQQAVSNATVFFKFELASLLEWGFGEVEARRITQPVLAVLGGESDALWPRFGEVHRLLLQWLPRVEGFVLPGATHGLQMQNPRGMAETLVEFWARHPMPRESRASGD
jgi:pimeloyl-ACP methyl ester carboxylesterase